ncbi:unnamed protein product [Pleuronectes platessa]|uniref:Uncharacterized protein n=1 Tax=Pleuronectes platessa TaxID=8262 RepID=A0A9N7TUL5_PLEPL|nr:unnamed protein product [Pleuronectes platessa]
MESSPLPRHPAHLILLPADELPEPSATPSSCSPASPFLLKNSRSHQHSLVLPSCLSPALKNSRSHQLPEPSINIIERTTSVLCVLPPLWGPPVACFLQLLCLRIQHPDSCRTCMLTSLLSHINRCAQDTSWEDMLPVNSLGCVKERLCA